MPNDSGIISAATLPPHSMKYCCFRFDADTHACVSHGIPALMDVAASLNVPFTFFVNMGRAFYPWITITKMLKRLVSARREASFSAAQKLGLLESVKAAVLNPRAGRSFPDILRSASRSGHEIGVHGGRNHACWARSASTWNHEYLREEVSASISWMNECGLESPVSFASPGWNSPHDLSRVLQSLGLSVLADTYDRTAESVGRTDCGLKSVPTNITAEPGNAGYLETLRARGWSTNRIREDFRNQLNGKTCLAVVYDHPFFAGTRDAVLVEHLITDAVNCGFKICTMREAAFAISGEVTD